MTASVQPNSEDLFVGGELYADDRFSLPQASPLLPGWHFLYGGQACLRVICRALRAMERNQILLPAYICPDVITVLQQEGMQLFFYQPAENLSPNLSHLMDQLERLENPVMYFVNYFGFPLALSTQMVFKSLQRQGVLLIEDNAQALFQSASLADFTFNSVRKFVPHDGGYLSSSINLEAWLPAAAEPHPRLPLIRTYRKYLAEYLLRDADIPYGTLVDLYEQTERAYLEHPVLAGDAQERQALEHLDWPAIAHARRANYHHLLAGLSELPQLQPLFPQLPPAAVPMALPVFYQGKDRQDLLDQLAEEGVNLNVHWEGIQQHALLQDYPEVQSLAAHIISLPVDQQTSPTQLDFLLSRMCQHLSHRDEQ